MPGGNAKNVQRSSSHTARAPSPTPLKNAAQADAVVPASTICRLHLTEQLKQQGVVDAAEHLLDASVGAPMAYVESLRKGIGVDGLLPVQSILTPPLFQPLF